MIRIGAVVALTSLVAVAWSPWVLGAGDAVRGGMLYRTTYSCTDCHSVTPSAGQIDSGSTAEGLLAVIRSVPPMRSRFLSTLGQNPTDLADIAAYIASFATGGGPDLNQHGLTGSWYEPATSGQGIELEFYPNHVALGTAFVQGAWFTFDTGSPGGADHDRWYTFDGNGQSGMPNVPITIYRNIGGNFNDLPKTSATVVGSGTLTFADCANATLAYTFSDGSGRAGTIPLTRLLDNVTCTVGATPGTNADFGFSGNWYDAATSGQGFVFEVNPLRPFFFLTWYTYAPNGQAAGVAGQRWFTGQASYTVGSRTMTAPLYETTGGLFDQPTDPPAATVPVGTATVTFGSCTSAQLQFNVTAGSSAGKADTIALTRVGPVPPGCGP
jgi:hypothetical protein